MIFTVLWKPDSQQQLAQLWINGPDRNAIAAAADRIDARLKQDPQLQGESRFGDLRILIELPLAVIFKVNEADRTVMVSDVWLWGQRP
jgi:hypothetical protein